MDIRECAYLDDGLIVNVTMFVHGCRVDLEDLESRLLVGKWHLNLAIKPARAQKCGIQRVRSVSRHDKFCAPERVEPIHLVQQLPARNRGSQPASASRG